MSCKYFTANWRNCHCFRIHKRESLRKTGPGGVTPLIPDSEMKGTEHGKENQHHPAANTRQTLGQVFNVPYLVNSQINL